MPAASLASSKPRGGPAWLRGTAGPVLLAVLVAGMTAGCGGTGPTSAEWVKLADEVCQRHQQEADQSRPVLYQPTLAQTLRRSAEASAGEAQELRDIEKPRDRRAEVREYLAAVDDRTRELQLLADQAEHPGENFQVPSSENLAAATERASTLAQTLKLQKCGAGIDVSVGATTTTRPADGVDPNAPPDTGTKDFETQEPAG